MNILMVGDVYGEPGRAAITKLLPRLRQEHAIDCCVVNVENAAGGFGVTPQIARQILAAGADVMTSGNHIWDKKEVVEYIVKENLLLRPANFPAGTPGVGHVTVKCGPHKVGVVNLMGRVFMLPIDCPFRKGQSIGSMKTRPMRFTTPTLWGPHLTVTWPTPGVPAGKFAGRRSRFSFTMYSTTSFLSQMWLPEVITSAPAARICRAICGVTPKPPAAFSTLTTQQSIACS